MSTLDARKMHQDLSLAGFRSLATAAGLFQLTRELGAAGVLPDDAIERVREAMLRELIEMAPRTIVNAAYEDRLRARLKALFSGAQRVSKDQVLQPAED